MEESVRQAAVLLEAAAGAYERLGPVRLLVLRQRVRVVEAIIALFAMEAAALATTAGALAKLELPLLVLRERAWAAARAAAKHGIRRAAGAMAGKSRQCSPDPKTDPGNPGQDPDSPAGITCFCLFTFRRSPIVFATRRLRQS